MTCKHKFQYFIILATHADLIHQSMMIGSLSKKNHVFFLLLCVTFSNFHSSAIEVSVLLGHCAMSVGSWRAITHIHNAMSQKSGDLVVEIIIDINICGLNSKVLCSYWWL